MCERTNRRAVLVGGGVAIGGALAGCTGFVTRRRDAEPVTILAAGSLNNALENGCKRAMGVPLRVEAHGSAEIARLVAADGKRADIVALSDVSLFDGPLHPPWFAEFVTNSVVVAYAPESDGGSKVAEAGTDRWYRPILDGEATLGRTDPDLDPLGYRSLMVLELATGFYDTDVDLRAAVPERNQIYPETQLIAQFETGSIDAALAYRNMAVERGYEFVELPPRINLGDPRYGDEYASAAYTLPDGTTVRGGVVSYGATVRGDGAPEAVIDVFEELTTGDYLNDFGFRVPKDYPRFEGDVPDEITN